MPLVTRFRDSGGQFAVEEDSRGRLWITVWCRGAGGFDELHRRLTPGESRDFERSGTVIRARARFLLAHPKAQFDPSEEAEYRKQ